MHHLTVAQNMFIGREPRGRLRVFLDEDKLNRQAREILDRIGLRVDPRAAVGGLTIAKQQMVEIAKALSLHSRVLIMDEPTAALNAAEVAELFSIIRELKAAGVGIVIHLAQDGGDQRDLRPRHGDARRRICGDRADGDHRHGQDHRHDGRPRTIRCAAY